MINNLVLIESIGAAIALLDSVYLPLWVTGVSFQTITYGLPRVSKHCNIPRPLTELTSQVGNPAFANYVDANLHLTHINNK